MFNISAKPYSTVVAIESGNPRSFLFSATDPTGWRKMEKPARLVLSTQQQETLPMGTSYCSQMPRTSETYMLSQLFILQFN
jgi:hypothetical protein